MSDVLTTVGRSVVQTSFKLRGRGSVLVFEKVDGMVPRNGKVWNGSVLVPYVGPDFLDGPDQSSKLAIAVADADIGALCEGSALRFTSGL
jgi:hypothetical protein